MPFTFEKLDVYQKSLKFIEDIEKLTQGLKGKISFSLLDQLQRAAISISLNIAEGNGRFHKKNKINFFYISRGSIFECVPILHVLKSRNKISDTEYDELYSKLEILSKMISGLINSIEKKPLKLR